MVILTLIFMVLINVVLLRIYLDCLGKRKGTYGVH